MSNPRPRKQVSRDAKQSVPPTLSVTAMLGARYLPFIETMLQRAIPLVPRAPREVSIALVNDARLADLHLRFMNIPGPTDVLTFELDHDPAGRVTSGEVVVCVPEARRKAKELGHRVEHELLLYALHGILHLSGHDDRTTPAYRRMHRMEDKILETLGIGAVFASKENA